MQYDGIPFIRPIKIPHRTHHPTVANELIPTKDQIISFISNAKPSTQTIISLIAFLGVRFKVIADLRVKDFPEMRITQNNEIIFENTPTRIKIRKELNKNGKEYQTFLIDFGCKIIKNYLEIRMRKGERINSESLIVPTECDKTTTRQRAKAISKRLKTVFEKVDYDSRPYSIKNFFATALMNSGIEQNWQTFFMGHSGVIQNEYTVRRQQPAEQIEVMRNIFKEKIQPNLVPQSGDAESLVREKFLKMGREMGLELKDDASTDEAISEIAVVYKSAQSDLDERKNSETKPKQKRIAEEELDQYLDKGWEVVQVLNSGKLIIKSPMVN